MPGKAKHFLTGEKRFASLTVMRYRFDTSVRSFSFPWFDMIPKELTAFGKRPRRPRARRDRRPRWLFRRCWPDLALACLGLAAIGGSAERLAAADETAAGQTPAAETFTAADLEFFEKKIRPVLAQHCYECHSDDAGTVQAGLRLGSRSQMLRGGDSGAAVVPGEPDESLLIRAVRYEGVYDMPPDGKLPDATIADLERWIRGGAAAPAGDERPAESPDGWEKPAGEHWAFRPPQEPAVPHSGPFGDWSDNPIDRFIAAALEDQGLAPSPQADPHTLIRRVYFDLVGLPPTPEEVQRFVADPSPEALDRVVEQLLASPQYGVRWGRHWLDLARYADTNGADENYAYHQAWRYRDYVVRAFNQDKPYDQFVREQIAGDLLPAAEEPGAADDQLTATGFLVLGPKMLAEQDKEKLVVDLVDEQIDTVGKTFLGLTLGCARCHDHKFDPVPTEDYYALAGIFLSTRTMKHLNHVSEWLERPLPGNGNAERFERLAGEIAAKQKELDAFPKEPDEEQQKDKERIASELEELKTRHAEVAVVMSVEEAEPRDVPVHIRGSHLNLASEPVPRGFLTIFDDRLESPEISAAASGRLELAEWLTDPRHPLTARVMVNRIWQHHFGQGLVRTPSDFGFRGADPTHPELLDWLSLRFIEDGWSVKQMHRRIIRSRAYQMASDDGPAVAVDPDNHLLWRQNRVRLDAEPIRDALLAVTRELDLSLGGSLEDTPRDSLYARTTQEPFGTNRRAIHLPIVRNRVHEMLSVFDYIDAGVHLEQRPTTTVAHQALFIMNNPWVMERGEALAGQLLRIDDVGKRIEEAYLRLYARPPRPDEREAAEGYLRAFARRHGDGDDAAWRSLTRVLLTLNEFLYVN